MKVSTGAPYKAEARRTSPKMTAKSAMRRVNGADTDAIEVNPHRRPDHLIAD